MDEVGVRSRPPRDAIDELQREELERLARIDALLRVVAALERETTVAATRDIRGRGRW